MEDNVLIRDYYERFNEFPPIIATISTDDELYLKLVAKALAEDKKIDDEMFEKVFKGVKYDLDTTEPFDETNEEDFKE